MVIEAVGMDEIIQRKLRKNRNLKKFPGEWLLKSARENGWLLRIRAAREVGRKAEDKCIENLAAAREDWWCLCNTRMQI